MPRTSAAFALLPPIFSITRIPKLQFPIENRSFKSLLHTQIQEAVYRKFEEIVGLSVFGKGPTWEQCYFGQVQRRVVTPAFAIFSAFSSSCCDVAASSRAPNVAS